MNFPIYCVETWDDRFVYLGGGGGNEIKNMIAVYPLISGQTVLKEETKIEEVKTDKVVPSFMCASRDVNLMVVNLGPDVAIYKID